MNTPMENEYPQSARRRPLDVDGIAVDYTIVRYGGGLREDGLGVDGGPGRHDPGVGQRRRGAHGPQRGSLLASYSNSRQITVPRGTHY